MNMTTIEKIEFVRYFVNKNDGYPIVWIEATLTIEKLENAVKLIQENPNLTLKEFRENLDIEEE